LQNIAMNSAEVGVDSFGKINIQPIGRLKIPAYAAEKFAQVFLLASYLRTQHNESAPLYCYY